MALLYDVGLRILLLHSMIDIAVSVYSSFGAFSAIVGLLFINNIVTFIEIIFLGLLFGLGFPTDAFFFNKGISSKGHLVINFALCSDSLMYSLLAMTTCFVCGAQIQKSFDVSGLYPIRIPSQTFRWSDFTLFSSRILQNAKLPKIQMW